jgi:hypothetical protein
VTPLLHHNMPSPPNEVSLREVDGARHKLVRMKDVPFGRRFLLEEKEGDTTEVRVTSTNLPPKEMLYPAYYTTANTLIPSKAMVWMCEETLQDRIYAAVFGPQRSTTTRK